VTVRMKHMAHEHAATVAALQLDRETALKVAQDEFRRVEEQLMCVPPPGSCVSVRRVRSERASEERASRVR